MFTWETITMFVAASAVLAFAPGPDNIFVLSQSILYGRRSGMIITLGLCTGLLVHTSAVALGVAVIFQRSAHTFSILKYCGALYLLYLAWQAFRSSSSDIGGAGESRLTNGRLYRRGIIMNVTNPKVSIFFLAFLPQFANSSNGPIALQMVLLGTMFIAVTIAVFGMISQLAGMIGRWISRSVKGQMILNRIAGTVFVALALRLIFIGQNG